MDIFHLFCFSSTTHYSIIDDYTDPSLIAKVVKKICTNSNLYSKINDTITKFLQFIYKLFDSVIRRYPIGTLITWQTKKSIPFRDFLKDYDTEKLEKIKDEGLLPPDYLIIRLILLSNGIIFYSKFL